MNLVKHDLAGEPLVVGGGIDSDAQAFITAASITDSTQQSAINTLVTQLKTYGIWTKLKAVYPFVGGTASSHKFNLKDPRDLDAAYRLVFNGGWVHSSTGALHLGTGIDSYSNREQAFASIGDGLTDTEAANFYTAVQTFQTTLNRQVGVPIVADSDAQAFLNAAVITDQTQASAINTLVTSLKSANIWTKMKAIYPFVGGTATTHKFNLKDPRDLDAAYRLVFNGGWTHSSTGAKPNGTTAYANTYLNPYVAFGGGNPLLPTNSTHQLVHISKYSRTNSAITDNFDGVYTGAYPQSCWLGMGWNSGWAPNGSGIINTRSTNPSSVSLGNRTDGFFVVNRDGYTSLKSFRNSVLVSTDSTESRAYNETGLQTNLNPQNVFLIGALNTAYDFTFRPLSYNNHEMVFQSIGTSLTDAEATAFYNAVQAYQTTLNRQVP